MEAKTQEVHGQTLSKTHFLRPTALPMFGGTLYSKLFRIDVYQGSQESRKSLAYSFTMLSGAAIPHL